MGIFGNFREIQETITKVFRFVDKLFLKLHDFLRLGCADEFETVVDTSDGFEDFAPVCVVVTGVVWAGIHTTSDATRD